VGRYVAFQFVKAALFMIHLLVLLFQVMSELSFLNVVQWVGSTLIGVHYYLNAWHPAMIEEPPLLGFKYYAFYMYCFFMCELKFPLTSRLPVWGWWFDKEPAREPGHCREATLRDSCTRSFPITRIMAQMGAAGDVVDVGGYARVPTTQTCRQPTDLWG
jgi:hypothetical protein